MYNFFKKFYISHLNGVFINSKIDFQIGWETVLKEEKIKFKLLIIRHEKQLNHFKKRDCMFFISSIRTIVIKSWKETHNNLFNFNLNDSQLTTQMINIMLKKVRIVKLGNQYQALFPNDPEFSKVMPPVMIDVSQLRDKDKFGQKKYNFHINQFPQISKPFWIVVKSLPSQKYCLKEGDIFKMGKIKLRVKQIIHKSSQTKDMNKQIRQAEYKIYNCEGNVCYGQEDDQQLKCRICMQQGEHSNPLLTICDCIGSSKYIHFRCLRQWFTTQLDPVRINQVTQINWKCLQCQLCKVKMPYSIVLDNQTFYLVQFPKFKKPYIVLNPVYKNNNEKSKIYYFVSFKKRNRMIIGRKSDADIQLCTDSTISRHHTVIQYEQKNPNLDGKFYLSDNGSKFGTVVLLNAKNSLCVDTKMNGIQFQVGGDLIKISYKSQNFLYNITTNQDEIDFNTDEQIDFVDFAQDETQQKGRFQSIYSQEDQKREITQENNHQVLSQIGEQHQNTQQYLVPAPNTNSQLKIHKI